MGAGKTIIFGNVENSICDLNKSPVSTFVHFLFENLSKTPHYQNGDSPTHPPLNREYDIITSLKVINRAVDYFAV